MRPWLAASIVFFAYVAVVTPLVPRLASRRRWLAAAGVAAGFLVCALAHATRENAVLQEWILPPVLLLLGYWTSGLLFSAPMPRAERLLASIDDRLGIDRVAAAMPRGLAELLEVAYAAVYPLVPAALVIHLFTSSAPDAGRFWTVILLTDFVCFGCLPWVQTRPPRAFRSADPWVATIRRVNLRLLGTASIQVNTFPSGHAAEAMAAVLLVLDAPWPLAAGVGLAALLVSAGTVFGRYHYAADAIAGWAVAVVVWNSL
jgi:membrane-associated phospholipid phosphatase